MTEESPRTSWLSKTSLDTQLEKLKKMFKVQDLPFGQEVKKIREILTPEILASGEFSQPLENWINSKEFIDLHPKQKFGLLFYLFLELGYSKNKDVFLEYISSDQFPFYSRFSILSLFHKDNKSVRDISLAFRETFKSQEEAFANAWDLFLSQFPVDEQKSLNKCLKIFFNNGKKWSLVNTEVKPFPFALTFWRRFDPKAYFFLEFTAGCNTMFQVCRNILKVLDEHQSDLIIIKTYQLNLKDEDMGEKLYEIKMRIALKSVSHIFRYLAMRTPNIWQATITESKYKLEKFDLNGEDKLLIIPINMGEFLMEDGPANVKTLTNSHWLSRLAMKSKKIITFQGCPAVFHPIFIDIPRALFKKNISK